MKIKQWHKTYIQLGGYVTHHEDKEIRDLILDITQLS